MNLYTQGSNIISPHLFTEMKDLHVIVQCLKDVDREGIVDVGLALGLYYPTLKEINRSPHDMVSAWLQQKDNVTEQTGPPTVQSLTWALKEAQLPGIAASVTVKF